MGCIHGKRYLILGEDKRNTYRVVDESGEDYLYSKSSFTDVEDVEPARTFGAQAIA
jgi:hypothetical protein